MYFVDAIKVLVRRWYIILLGLMVLAGAAAITIKVTPTDYQASGQVLMLLPPEASGKSTPTNPFLNLQGGLETTAALVAGNLTTKDTQRELKKQGFPAEYSIALSPNSGPLLSITTKNTNPEATIATRDEVIRRIHAELALVQKDPQIPKAQLIHADDFSVTSQAEVLPGRKIRALAVLGAVISVTTAVLAFGLDKILLERSRRKKGEKASPERKRWLGKNGKPGDDERPDVALTTNGKTAKPERILPRQVEPSDDRSGSKSRSPASRGAGSG